MSEVFHDLPYGHVASYDDNELEVRSTIADPPKVRLAVDDAMVESNLGALSFNRRRSDGRHEEYAQMMGRMAPDMQGGAAYIAVRPAGQPDVKEVAYWDSNNIVMRAGPYALVFQGGDGNLVGYDTRIGGGIGDPAAAIWSAL